VQTIANRLRSAFARRFLLSVRRATHRLPVQLETLRRQRVLVVAPHMDDEVIGCGGTLLLHRKLRSDVRVVFVSDSSGAVDHPRRAETLRDIRHAEMMKVSAALALGSVVELGFADGALMRHEEAIAARLAQELRSFRPTGDRRAAGARAALVPADAGPLPVSRRRARRPPGDRRRPRPRHPACRLARRGAGL